VTVDEARDIYTHRDEHDDATVRRAMRVIEQDANDRWGAEETRQALARPRS
jgi:hypothetical protein